MADLNVNSWKVKVTQKLRFFGEKCWVQIEQNLSFSLTKELHDGMG